MKKIFKKILEKDYKFLNQLNNFYIKDENGYSLLDYSIFLNDFELFTYLLKKVDINNINNFGENSLFLAIRKKNIKFIDLLIKNNININLKNNFLETPLFIACKTGDINIIKLLIYYGSNLNEYNYLKQTPFHYYLINGHTKYIDFLIDIFNINYSIKDKYNNTLIHYLSKYSNCKILKKFIEKNIDINHLNINFEHPIKWAINLYNDKNIKVLLNYDNFVFVSDIYGKNIVFHIKNYNNEYINDIFNLYLLKNKKLYKYELIYNVLNKNYYKLKSNLFKYISIKDNYYKDEYEIAKLYKIKKAVNIISSYRAKKDY